MEKNSSRKIKAASAKITLKRLLYFIKPYRSVYLTGWLFLVLSSATAMLFPALMGQLLGANPNEKPIMQLPGLDFNNINNVLLVMLIVFGAQAIFSFFRVVLFNQVTEQVLRDIRLVSFNRLLFYPLISTTEIRWVNSLLALLLMYNCYKILLILPLQNFFGNC
ncbi:MAG: hypothetical protein IPM74_06515 [Crocinitomicaceae bacterium]|nr:hypothetical protein [Crocinitomicaceae bacterium]